jgi:aerobic C4-dicarboxylate transport protein
MSIFRKLYFQVLVAIVVGACFGAIWPVTGAAMKPLGDAFINLIRMMIGPIIFCTVVHGIGSMQDLRKVGRIGIKALLCFEVVSTVALILGLIAGHVMQPGSGIASHMMSATGSPVADYVNHASNETVVNRLMGIIPVTFVGALAEGNLLQVILVSILTGVALAKMGDAGRQVTQGIEAVGKVFFRVIGLIVWLAPWGTFGAVAYTIGSYGLSSLVSLGELVAAFYLASAVFVIVGLGALARLLGFSIFRFLAFVREELFIVLGTASSETVLPNLMRKLESLGAPEATVGLTVPLGYSFNLCGTNIYMTLGILFLAQATNTHLSFAQEATILLISMLTSKGAAGVAGAGFITLAATLVTVPDIPIASLGLLLGVDRFMSQCRAATNFIANGVITLVVARWEGELDPGKMMRLIPTGVIGHRFTTIKSTQLGPVA